MREYRPLNRLTSEEILEALNLALLAELQAVADYDAHARASQEPAVREAFETLRDVEREHAVRVAARITALGGTPASLAVEPHLAGDTLAAWLTRDLQGEQWAIVEYARLVAGIVDDDNTVELLAELLFDEIRHATWLKSSLRALPTKE